MSEEIFRKKSLDRVKSPESLDDYIRVSSPGVWLLLASVIILLAGACVWGFFGHIDSTVPSTVRIEQGSAVCYVSEEDILSVKPGMTVSFADQKAAVADIGQKDSMGFACTLSGSFSLADGLYDGKVVIESYNPLAFILN